MPSTETSVQLPCQPLPVPPDHWLPHGESEGVVRNSQEGQEIEGPEEKRRNGRVARHKHLEKRSEGLSRPTAYYESVPLCFPISVPGELRGEPADVSEGQKRRADSRYLVPLSPWK